MGLAQLYPSPAWSMCVLFQNWPHLGPKRYARKRAFVDSEMHPKSPRPLRPAALPQVLATLGALCSYGLLLEGFHLSFVHNRGPLGPCAGSTLLSYLKIVYTYIIL